MSTLKLKTSEVFQKNYEAFNNPGIRNIVNIGGSRSGKTVAISQLILLTCLTTPNIIFSVVRKTLPSLKYTAMRDIIELLKDYGIYDEKMHNKSDSFYTFTNGSIIEFFSLDDSQKIRGRRRDHLFLNEGNEIDFETFNQLNMRTTGKILCDLNPSESEHWLYELADKPDSIKIHSTFRDNPFLEKSIIKQIEDLKYTDFDLYQIYNLGVASKSTTTVYNHQQQYTTLPDLPFQIIYGLDFGYQHPTALIKCYIFENQCYLEEVIYQSHLTTDDLITLMKELEIPKNADIAADWARPEIISQLRQAGYNIYNADKSVLEGIRTVKSYKLFYKITDKNLHKEFKNYKWKLRQDGTVTDEVVKLYDDALDSVRMGLMHHKKFNTSSDNFGYMFG